MEAVDVVSYIGLFVSTLLCLSGFPFLRAVLRAGSADGFTKLPTITVSVVCLMTLLYAIFVIKRVDGFLICNAVGLLLWFINFVVLFAWSSPGKRCAFGATYVALLASGIALYLVLFVALEPTAVSVNVVAAVGNSFNIFSFLSPVRAIAEALRALDTERVPQLFSILTAVNCSLWMSFGLLLAPPEPWIWAPNLLGVSISVAQLVALAYIHLRIRAGGKPASAAKQGAAANEAAAEAPAAATAAEATSRKGLAAEDAIATDFAKIDAPTTAAAVSPDLAPAS